MVARGGVGTTLDESFSSNELGIIQLVFVLVTFFALWLFLRKEWKEENFWDTTGLSGKNVFLCSVVAFPLSSVLSGVVVLFYTHVPELFTEYRELMESVVGGNLVLLILVTVLLVPVLEEVLFRGVIQKRLMGTSMKLPLVILIQALIFVLFHWNVIQSTYAFLAGILLGLVYAWFPSIWIPIAMHIAFNFYGTVVVRIFPDMSYLQLFVYWAVSAVVLVWLIRVIWKRREGSSGVQGESDF
jgi:membrane protease YdiL (CAAX protease family)